MREFTFMAIQLWSFQNIFFKHDLYEKYRVSVQGVKSVGGHFACLYQGFEFYEVKKNKFVIIFQKEMVFCCIAT